MECLIAAKPDVRAGAVYCRHSCCARVLLLSLLSLHVHSRGFDRSCYHHGRDRPARAHDHLLGLDHPLCHGLRCRLVGSSSSAAHHLKQPSAEEEEEEVVVEGI